MSDKKYELNEKEQEQVSGGEGEGLNLADLECEHRICYSDCSLSAESRIMEKCKYCAARSSQNNYYPSCST